MSAIRKVFRFALLYKTNRLPFAVTVHFYIRRRQSVVKKVVNLPTAGWPLSYTIIIVMMMMMMTMVMIIIMIIIIIILIIIITIIELV